MRRAVARIHWLSEQEGGRRTAVSSQRYMGPAEIDGPGTSAGLWTLVVERASTEPEADETVEVHFLMDDAPHDRLRAGAGFRLMEGARTVARGVVERVLERSAAA